MRKRKLLLPLSCLIVLAMASMSFAGLINYDRIQRRKEGRTGAPAGDDTRPKWMRQAQPAESYTERRYDVNRDGILQTAEVKIFLRDVIQIVDRRGGYTVDSDLLKEYDKNRDGLISKTEIQKVKDDAYR